MRAVALVVAVVTAACSRDPSRTAGEVPVSAAPPAVIVDAAAAAAPAVAHDDGCTVAPPPLRRPAPRRLVAIGDLHGDLAATRAILRAAGAIDGEDRWIGGDLVIVQTGDQTDRGDDEQAILDLLEALEREASAAGGALIWLLGNHELMNTAGDFRYVTPGGFADFADAPGVDPAQAPAAIADPAIRARAAAMFPGGPYARIFGGQAVVAIVGDTVFSHAGVLPAWTARLDEVNRSADCWMVNGGPPPEVLEAQDGPVWTRDYGRDPADCTALDLALTALNAKRMVVGHTPQETGVTSACGGKLWRIDVGLSKHYGGPIEALSITRDGNKERTDVVRGKR